jgi:hypothetical protein
MNKKYINNFIKSDLYRYGGETSILKGKNEGFKKNTLKNVESKYSFAQINNLYLKYHISY